LLDFTGSIVPREPYFIMPAIEHGSWLGDVNPKWYGEGSVHTFEYDPPEAGEYKFVLYYNGRDIGDANVTAVAHEGKDRSVSAGFAAVAVIGIAAGLVAVFVGMKRR